MSGTEKEEWRSKGYIITKEGKICSPAGNWLNVRGGNVITLDTGRMTVARFIYITTKGNIPEKHKVDYKDGNDRNLAPDNLYLAPKRGTTSKFKTTDQADNIKADYKKLKNAKIESKTFRRKDSGDIFEELARKYACSKSTIQKIVYETY